jgi:enoyl-CoA hydratase
MKIAEMENDPSVTTEQQGHVLIIGMNRTSHRNRVDPGMYMALARAYDTLEQDEELWVGVLHGYGPDFSCGLDAESFYSNAFRPHLESGQFKLDSDGLINPLGTTAPYLTKPLVVAVQGAVWSLANELLLAADVRIAASDAQFFQSEVTRATLPAAGGTVRFPREVGWGNAMRYMLSGDGWDAQEAYRMGLIQEVVAPGEQLKRAVELAHRIAENAPLSVRATLSLARRAYEEGEETAFAALMPELVRLMGKEDFQERLKATQEARKPNYRGR